MSTAILVTEKEKGTRLVMVASIKGVEAVPGEPGEPAVEAQEAVEASGDQPAKPAVEAKPGKPAVPESAIIKTTDGDVAVGQTMMQVFEMINS